MIGCSQAGGIFGRNVARRRKQLGFSQASLAELASVHCRYVQKIEAGQANVSLDILRRLRRALECEWRELFQDID